MEQQTTPQKEKKSNAGRPTKEEELSKKITEGMSEAFNKEEKIARLKVAASIGSPPVEQYHYAGIAKSTYYLWMKENSELMDELNTLENAALRIKARRNMAERIESKDIGVSMEYLRRTDDKMRTQKIEHSGEITKNNVVTINIPGADELRREYERKMFELTAKALEEPKTEQLPENTQETAEITQN